MSGEREGELLGEVARERLKGRQTARQKPGAKSVHRQDLLKIVRC